MELYLKIYLWLLSRKVSHNLISKESIKVIVLYLYIFILSREKL